MPSAFRRVLLGLLLAPLLTGCGSSRGAFTEKGIASFYADKFNGRATTSGEIYRPGKLTAAHNTLPFGTVVRVTSERTHKSVKVTVNDRGPHVKGRVIDLSKQAARKIGLTDGLAPVQLKVVKPAPARR